ncbi:MAG: hypothetical protein ABIP13_05070 [Tepidiformaceae bacterium]
MNACPHRPLRRRPLHTEIFEADPFGGSRGQLLASIESDYRWEKGDEVWVETAGERVKLRVTWVNVAIRDGALSRELLGLKL